MLLIVLVEDETAVETASTKTNLLIDETAVETASTKMKKTRRRLKPRLQKRSPPPRTEEHNIIQYGSDQRFKQGKPMKNRHCDCFVPRNDNLK